MPTVLSPAAKLATQLLFQADRHQPVRMTRTRSMAAAHLTPRRIGVLVATTAVSSGGAQNIDTRMASVLQVDHLLRAQGIRSNHVDDEWTGVSLQRWKDLLVTISSDLTAAEKETGVNASPAASSLVIPLWLNALWEISRDKSCLLEFLLAVERTTQQSVLNNDEFGNALRYDPVAQREWAANTFSPKSLNSDSVAHALDVLMTSSPHEDPAYWSQALEVTCASMAVQHAYKPAIAPGKYGYDGGEPKSDCVEVTVRELFDLLLWDESTGTFDLTRLPPTASPELVGLYEQQADGERWFQALSNLPGCEYLMVSPNGKPYELSPTLANISEVTRLLLGDSGGERAASLDNVSKLWGSQQKKLHVSVRLSRHRAALGEEMVTQEIATIFLEGGKNGIEMRLDRAHGICTVTHLRFQSSSLDDKSITMLLSQISDNEPALKTLALAMIGDRGLLQVSSADTNSELLVKLLATPFGPDRRGLLHVVGTPDLARRQRDVVRALEDSKDVIRRALSEISNMQGEPELQRQLLLWMLSETPLIIDDESSRAHVKRYDPKIEKMMLALPTDLSMDDSIHDALQSSWAVRGKLVTRLMELQLGRISATHDVIKGLSVGEMLSLVSLYAGVSLTQQWPNSA